MVNFFNIFIIIFYIFLILVFPIRFYWDVDKLQYLDEPVIYSTNWIFFTTLQPENCIDGKLFTSCKEICSPGKISKNKIQKKQDRLILDLHECGFVVQLSPTHIMYTYPPEINPLIRFGIYLSREDLKHNVPKKIKLILYEQELYHINHDYRFPDQPIYVKEKDIIVQRKQGWQYWDIPEFNFHLESSKGFPHNVKQRWLKIRVEEIYKNASRFISISEFKFLDTFYNP